MSVQPINKKKFEEESKKNQNIIINFHAISWCAPCKQLSPIFEEVSKDIKTDFYEVDVDQEPELANEFNILSVPTIIILKYGQEISRIHGTLSKESLKNQILSQIK